MSDMADGEDTSSTLLPAPPLPFRSIVCGSTVKDRRASSGDHRIFSVPWWAYGERSKADTISAYE